MSTEILDPKRRAIYIKLKLLKIAIRGVEISRLQRKEKYLSLLKNTKTTANFVVFQHFPSS